MEENQVHDAGRDAAAPATLFNDVKLSDDAEQILLAANAQIVDPLMSAGGGALLQDPDSAWELHYRLFDRLKRKYIPTGAAGQPVRDEINTFAKEGRRERSDVRQARTNRYAMAANEITAWVDETGGNDVTALYMRFRALNAAEAATVVEA